MDTDTPKFLWHVTSKEHRASILDSGLIGKWSAFANEYLVWCFGSLDDAEKAVKDGLVEGDIIFRIDAWSLDVRVNPHPWYPGRPTTWVISGDVYPGRLVPYRLDTL